MLNWLLPFGQSIIKNSVEGLAGRAFKIRLVGAEKMTLFPESTL